MRPRKLLPFVLSVFLGLAAWGPVAKAAGGGGFPVSFHSSGELNTTQLKARLSQLLSTAGNKNPEAEKLGRLFAHQMPGRYRWNVSLEGGRLLVKLMSQFPSQAFGDQSKAYFQRGGAPLDLRHRVAVEKTLFSLSVGDPIGLGKVLLEALAALSLSAEEKEKVPQGVLDELLKMLPPGVDLSPDSPQIQTLFDTLEQAVGDELDLVVFPPKDSTSDPPFGFGLMLKLKDASLLQGILALAIPPELQEGEPTRKKGFTLYPLKAENQHLAIGLSDQWVFLTNDPRGMLDLIRPRPIMEGLPPRRLFYQGQLNLKLLREVVGEEFDREFLPQSGEQGAKLYTLQELLDFAPESLDRVYFTVGKEGDWQVTTIDADADLISLIMLLMAKQAQGGQAQSPMTSELPPTPPGYETAVSSANADLIAQALASYLNDHGKLPRHLDRLVEEEYLEGMPLNPYTNQPLREVGPGEFSPGDVVYLVYRGGKKAELLFFGPDPDGGLDVFSSSGENRFAGYPSPIGSDGSPDGVVVWISIGP